MPRRPITLRAWSKRRRVKLGDEDAINRKGQSRSRAALGHALSLHVPLAVAAAGYLLAIALTWIAVKA